MNVIVLIVVGGLTGWLTGKAVEVEGRINVVREGHVIDAIYGIIGALIGEYLFFWIVIGQGNAFSSSVLPFWAPSLSWEPLACWLDGGTVSDLKRRILEISCT